MTDSREELKKKNAKLEAEMTTLENEIKKLEKIIDELTEEGAYKLVTYGPISRFRFRYPCIIYGHTPAGKNSSRCPWRRV